MTHEKGMVGRYVDKNGIDIGDKKFHEISMNTGPNEESADSAVLREKEVLLAIRQADEIAKSNPELGKRAYKSLVDLYPSNALVGDWKNKA